MATYRHWSVSLWRDPDDVSRCWIQSPDKTEWRLISATLCGRRRCFVADQLRLMTFIREEEEDGSQRYEQFLQVGQLYRASVLLGLALCLPSASVSSVFMVLHRYYFFCLHSSLYLLVHWAWWDWPLTWLTNRCPSVLWHCWLGHVTRKIVPEMTYNVLNGTLNTTIPHSDSVVKMVLYWVVSVGVCVCFSILEPFEMSPWIFYSSKIRS